MLTWHQLATFVPAAMALLVVPGPSVLFVITRGVALGRRAALATVLGNELGACVHVVAVAVGIGAIVQRSVAVFTVMKLAGAVYLVWLGVRAIRERRELRGALGVSAAARSRRRLVWDGFVVGVSNPKTTLFFLAVLPQFVRPAQGHVTLQLLTLGLTFVALAFINDGLYGIAAGSVRRWLDRSPRRADLVGGTSGVIMIGLGLRLAVTGRRD
jgi:threonine/homoserine/homoserine lactone efflux protein